MHGRTVAPPAGTVPKGETEDAARQGGRQTMALGFLKKLFSGGGGSGGTHEAPPQEYNGYTIVATPQRDAGGWRVMGVISKEVEGEQKTHTFVRADTNPDLDGTVNLTVRKAKRLIDEQGDRIFG